MKKKSKMLGLLISICLMLSVLAGCGANSEANNEQAGSDTGKSYKLAFFGPLSGDAMQYGVAIKDAVELEIKKVNDEGGINGVPVELKVFDDKNDPKESVNIANKIVSDPEILVAIGSFSSSCSLAAAPVFQKNQVPLFSPTASHPDFPFAGDYMFTLAMTQKLESKKFAEFVIDQFGQKKVATIYQNTDYGVTANEIFVNRIKELGGEVTGSEQFISGQTKDYSPLISKIKAQQPDIFYVIGTYSEAAQIIQQAKALDLKAQYIGNGQLIREDFLKLVGANGEGLVVMSSIPVFLSSTLKNQTLDAKTETFVTDFKNAYQAEADGFSAMGYDSASLIVNAILKAGDDKKGIRDALAQTKEYAGVSGNLSFMDTREVERSLINYRIKDGTFIPYVRE
ncbi:ABC transporter substrate-binding protein [Paenibacillus sp. URB8-2]|uniref:ABC transporter substrate-binding protein n=1 Tax=Paenibacillus sp. URB8-2 TaxID=2741301 RepID=UPI0015B819A0|nr:ABC transporter substrate-binding protein [Paenibacillus sp. URB8-2]BCG58786.1 hypothetical protein PUR_22110 [Paenibacillus sp. URB8-2]